MHDGCWGAFGAHCIQCAPKRPSTATMYTARWQNWIPNSSLELEIWSFKPTCHNCPWRRGESPQLGHYYCLLLAVDCYSDVRCLNFLKLIISLKFTIYRHKQGRISRYNSNTCYKKKQTHRPHPLPSHHHHHHYHYHQHHRHHHHHYLTWEQAWASTLASSTSSESSQP